MKGILRTPFQLFGQVLDLEGSPIAGAIIEASIMDNLVKGTPFQTTSDASGRITIKSQGAALYVEVSKPGYYSLNSEQTTEPSKRGFDYVLGSANGLVQTSIANPAVFRLLKSRNPVELQRLSVRSKIQRDGRSVEVELAESSDLVMEVSCLTLEGEKRPNNQYRLEL